MSRLQSLVGRSASLGRRHVLVGGVGLTLVGWRRSLFMSASRTPRLNMKRLNAGSSSIAQRARPGVLGFGLMNLESGEFFVENGDRTFPMVSVFKLPLAASVLSEVDAGALNLAEMVTLRGLDLSPPFSPIADAWPMRSTYSLGELFTAALRDSDNTAADVLMRRIGGPGAISGWLQNRKIQDVRVDRYERELATDTLGMASFRAAWKGAAAFDAAIETVPAALRRAATLRYMADPRDSATPRGMLGLLRKLDDGELLSRASTHLILKTLQETERGADRIKAGFPPEVSYAHRPGTSGADQGLSAAFNDVGIFVLPDKRRYAIAAFLTGSTAPEKDRAALLAELGRLAIKSVG